MEIVTYMRGKLSISPMKVANRADALWQNREPDFMVGRYDCTDYARRMLTSAAQTALRVSASHSDDIAGTMEYQKEIDDLANGYAPDYEDALPADAREALEEDVSQFLAMAWPYLAREDISPETAGHLFQLDRSGAGRGFRDDYLNGLALSVIADTLGEFGLEVTGHGDESDGCDVCGEGIERVTGPVEDSSEEWVHIDRAIADHKPAGPLRVYAYHD